MQEHIIGVLRKYHDNPPVEDMRKALGMQLDKDAARDILFFPQPEHMAHYIKCLGEICEQKGANLVSKAAKGSKEDRSKHLNALFLNVFVLWHSRQWILARAFIVHGGLQALVLLQHPHLDPQIRWNSIEVVHNQLHATFCAAK